jgi:hypothetical protein
MLDRVFLLPFLSLAHLHYFVLASSFFLLPYSCFSCVLLHTHPRPTPMADRVFMPPLTLLPLHKSCLPRYINLSSCGLPECAYAWHLCHHMAFDETMCKLAELRGWREKCKLLPIPVQSQCPFSGDGRDNFEVHRQRRLPRMCLAFWFLAVDPRSCGSGTRPSSTTLLILRRRKAGPSFIFQSLIC